MSDHFTFDRISQTGQDLMKDYPPEVEKPAGIDVRMYESSIRTKPRPSRETHPVHGEDALRAMQLAWDYWTAVYERLDRIAAIDKKRRDDEAAAVKATQDAAAQERADAKRAELLKTLERRYVAAGGTAEEFKQDQDEILRQHLIAEAINPNGADAQARRTHQRMYTDF